jgi:hypothetical protein
MVCPLCAMSSCGMETSLPGDQSDSDRALGTLGTSAGVRHDEDHDEADGQSRWANPAIIGESVGERGQSDTDSGKHRGTGGSHQHTKIHVARALEHRQQHVGHS